MTLSELEEEARKRKERLEEWKNSKAKGNSKRKEFEDEEEKKMEEETMEFPKPIFRNYKPRDSTQLPGAIVLPRPELVDVKSLVNPLSLSLSLSVLESVEFGLDRGIVEGEGNEEDCG